MENIVNRMNEIEAERKKLDEEYAALKKEYSSTYPSLRARHICPMDSYFVNALGSPEAVNRPFQLNLLFSNNNLWSFQKAIDVSVKTRIMHLIEAVSELFAPGYIPDYANLTGDEHVVRYDYKDKKFYAVAVDRTYSGYDTVLPDAATALRVAKYLDHLMETGTITIVNGVLSVKET